MLPVPVATEARQLAGWLEDSGMSARNLHLVSALTIAPRRARFLWDGRIPLGNVTIVAGAPGLGKTTLLKNLGAAATRGTLAGDLDGEPTSVIYASAEDSPETTLLPRHLAHGGDPAKLYFVEVALEDKTPDALTLPDDVQELGRLAGVARARLLVLDPVVAYMPHEINSHKDQHVRRVLHPLALMAAELDLAVVAVMHLNKGDGHEILNRIGGSVGFGGAARSVLYFTRDPDDPDGERGQQRIIAHPKCNVGPEMPSLNAQIEPAVIHDHQGEPMGTSRLVLGDASDYTARDLLANGSVGGEEATARGEAKAMLVDELADGPRRVAELKHAAEAAGISWPTVERAKKQLKVRARKAADHWSWELPEQGHHPISPPDGLDGVDGLEGVKAVNTIKAAEVDNVMALAVRGDEILERNADLNGGQAA
jgi:hypothetical protein